MINHSLEVSKKEFCNAVKSAFEEQRKMPQRSVCTCIVGDRYVVKMPFNDQASELVQKEVSIANVLKERALPFQTPKWQRVDIGSDLRGELSEYSRIPPFCAVAPMIKGKHPVTLNNNGIMSDLGRFFAALHKIPVENFVGVPTYMDMDFHYMIDTWQRQNRHEGISNSRWQKFKRHLKNTVLRRVNEFYVKNLCPVLTHADLHVGNVLVDDNNHLVGVLDFGNAMLTSEPQDVMIAQSRFECGKTMLSSYQGYLGRRVDEQEKLKKTWRLSAKMNGYSEQLLERFLAHERQRG